MAGIAQGRTEGGDGMWQQSLHDACPASMFERAA